jgi:beta-glucosidase
MKKNPFMKKTIITAVLMSALCIPLNAQVYLDEKAPLEQRVQDALSRMTTHEKIVMCHAQGKFSSPGCPRLGIPQLMFDDGPHGVRMELEWNTWDHAGWTNDSVVAFPTLTCLAATWNPSMSALYGKSLGEEFAFRGKSVMCGPGVNIYREPLNGRNFEYMGEDPYLAGRMVVPYIQNVQKNGVATCLKHFFGNNQEADRFGYEAFIDERAVHEIYLPAFETGVKDGHAWSIMGSYNLWLGKHNCNNDTLLNGILKHDWGFDGAVVSDWGGAVDTWQAATGGLDIEMGTGTNGFTSAGMSEYDQYYLGSAFEKLINEKKIPMSVLNDKATRILRLIYRTSFNRNRSFGSLCSEAHYDACRQIGGEGVVLLKNAGLLPLDVHKYKHVLVVGENATRNLTEGGGSSELKTKRDISPLEAIRALFGNVDYAKGYYSGRAMYDHEDAISVDTLAMMRADAIRKAKDADLIIYVGGMNKNSYQDCENGERHSFNLSYEQDALIDELAKVCPNIVLVMNSGNAYAMPWLSHVKALLQAWYLGSEAGNTMVDILTGKVNPSGKLPFTFNKKVEDYPAVGFGKESYPGVDHKVVYKEGILVGYRWNDTKNVAPLFPFGYGMSYTQFKYGKAVLSADKMSAEGSVTVTVPVTNVGKVAGKEVVQLYVGDDKCTLLRPQKELKHFEKVALNPGETKNVTFTISPKDLQFYSDVKHEWTIEPGTFTVYVGSSSRDIKAKKTFAFE